VEEDEGAEEEEDEPAGSLKGTNLSTSGSVTAERCESTNSVKSASMSIAEMFLSISCTLSSKLVGTTRCAVRYSCNAERNWENLSSSRVWNESIMGGRYSL